MTKDSDLRAPTRDFPDVSVPETTVPIAELLAGTVLHRTDCGRKEERVDIGKAGWKLWLRNGHGFCPPDYSTELLMQGVECPKL